jgi:acetylornithine/succinyldiaminopimelate/putrescine aminotransferase
MAATGQPHYQNNWKPLMPGFVNVEFNNLEAIKNAYDKNKTCAVLLEPIQGEGGVNVPSENYLKDVMEFCHEKNILFMLDEVQTGMGRLGTLFGYQKFKDVQPDVMTLAKALGAGTPLGAFLTKDSCDVFEPGDHGSTFGGNALTTAAGGAAAKVIVEQNIPQLAEENGEYIVSKLTKLKPRFGDLVTDIRGKGLLIGLEMNQDIAGEIVKESLKNGLLINAVRPNMIRFMPPLNVAKNEIDEALEILEKVIKSIIS